jgi:pimeloyl-ACP methyl ester carboxylesterase
MVNGITILPHIYGSLNGISDYIEELGLKRPRVATHYWRWCFQKEMRRIYQRDPEARFVLIGYSMGGGVVQEIARTMAAEGIPIALVVFIDAHGICSDLDHRPGNVVRTVNINSQSPILHGRVLADAENYQVNTFRHLAAPKNVECLETLARELIGVASGSVPPSHTPVPAGANCPPIPAAPR